MFCRNCGAEMPDGVKFCSACGSILSVETAEPVAPAAQAEPDFDATIIADADVPAAPVAPVYQAPAAPVTPEPPVYKAPAAPVQPAYQVPVASAAPAGSDFDATVIADAEVPAAPVAPDTPAAPVPPAAPVYQAPVTPPAAPAAPVYQAPVTPPAAPATPVYQAPVTPPAAPAAPVYAPAYQQAAAAPKKKLDTKMIAIIGGAAFIIIALIVGILFATGVFDGKSKDGDENETKGDSVSADVKDYFKEELEYYDCELSGFTSECKVKSNGAYYQLISADMEYEDEKGYLLCYVVVYGDEIIEGDWMDFEDEESFNETLKEMKDDAEENEEEYIEELNEIAEEYAE